MKLSALGIATREQAKLEPTARYELWSVPSYAGGAPEMVVGKEIGSAKLRVQPDDVLICKINPRINRVWQVTPSEDGVDQIASPEWLVFRRKSDAVLAPRWLVHFVSSPKFRDWIASEVSGSTGSHTRARAEDIMQQEMPLPPLAEQQRIVEILDEAFDGIATAKANAEQNLRNTRALFDSHVHARFAQRGPNWIDTMLERISTNLDSKRIPITKSVRSKGEYPYYGASGIVDFVGEYIFEGDALLVSEDGANLLARSTPIAFSVSGKYWVNNHAHILKFQNMATQRFVEFYLESIKLDDFVTGAAQPKLNQRALNSIPIPIPQTIEEQSSVVADIESMMNETQQLGSAFERKIVVLDELKKTLLQKAFDGEL